MSFSPCCGLSGYVAVDDWVQRMGSSKPGTVPDIMK